ncbi:MAG TPA: MATE family efflux transporter [Dongiaceae bacterium]|jgi:MATE family multidrug resistance protein
MNSDFPAAPPPAALVLPTDILAAQNHFALHRRIWRIALPAILANLTTVLPGLCDMAFIGRSGHEIEQGGVAIGTTFCGLLLWAFSFLRMGTTGVTAQGYGANDPSVVRQAIDWSLILAIGFGLGLILAAVPLGAFILPLYGGPLAEQDLAAEYFHLRMLAAPFDLCLFAVMGWLIGVQRARTVFVIQLLLNSINVALCYLFVVVLDYGVVGVAGATSLAQTATALAAVAWVYRMTRRLQPAAKPIGSRVPILQKLVAINRDIFIRTIVLLFVFTYFVHLGAGLSAVTLAANQILLGFLSLISFGLDGFAQSAETLVGEALGARNPRLLSGALWGNLFWGAALAAAMTAILWAAGPIVLPWFSANPAVVEAARAHYLWVSAQPLVAVWCFLLDGVFIGATRGRELRNGMMAAGIIGLIAMQAGLWLFGNNGLWTAFMLFFALRALPLAWWYRRIPASLAS